MSVHYNIRLATRWFQEVWNEGKMETVHELLSSDAVAIGQAGGEVELHGPQEFVPFVEQIRTAFPDIKVDVEDAFGADNKVVLRWSARMSHRGHTLGIPATGKPVRLTGISIVQIVNGKIVAGWDNWDQLGMLQQIGAYGQRGTVALGKPAR
jgi:steroid delta-isomerase-like uncharacterized protein